MEVSIPWGYRDIIQSSWHPRGSPLHRRRCPGPPDRVPSRSAGTSQGGSHDLEPGSTEKKLGTSVCSSSVYNIRIYIYIYMYHSLSRRYFKKNTQTLDPVLAYHEKSNNFLKQTFMEVCPISISQMGSWGRNTGDARVVSTSGAECHDFSGNIDMTSLVINPYTLW